MSSCYPKSGIIHNSYTPGFIISIFLGICLLTTLFLFRYTTCSEENTCKNIPYDVRLLSLQTMSGLPLQNNERIAPDQANTTDSQGQLAHKIAFISERDGNGEIYVSRSDGTDPISGSIGLIHHGAVGR